MPTVIRCKKCGHVLAEYPEIPPNYYGASPYDTWYSKLFRRLNGECPQCSHKLPTAKEYKQKMQWIVKAVEA